MKKTNPSHSLQKIILRLVCVFSLSGLCYTVSAKESNIHSQLLSLPAVLFDSVVTDVVLETNEARNGVYFMCSDVGNLNVEYGFMSRELQHELALFAPIHRITRLKLNDFVRDIQKCREAFAKLFESLPEVLALNTKRNIILVPTRLNTGYIGSTNKNIFISANYYSDPYTLKKELLQSLSPLAGEHQKHLKEKILQDLNP